MIRTSSDLMLEEIVLMKHGEIDWREDMIQQPV